MLIESAIARETARGSEEAAANIIVLDDVTPPYVKATAALRACDANLGIALHSLLDSRTSSAAPARSPKARRRFRSSARKRTLRP